MTNPNELIEMAVVLVATVTPIVAAIRLLAGWTNDVEGLIQFRSMTWPQGVQEEEPPRWNFGAAA
jgi:hypothetical protein